ncbi:MAG: uracil-DNA glycosylase family protein, partial [Candidatus Saccharimonadales bacterium]
MIQGSGPSAPKAMFIADGPISTDFETNVALSGYSAKLLKECCDETGLYFNEFYRTALVKEKLPQITDYKRLSPEVNNLLNQYGPILTNEVQALSPHLLIPLGELSFQYLTGLKGIRKFRGSVMLADAARGFEKPTKVMPILGPYPYLYQEHNLK